MWQFSRPHLTIFQKIHAVKSIPVQTFKIISEIDFKLLFFAISLFYTLLRIKLYLFNRRNQINRIEIRVSKTLKCTVQIFLF